METAFALKGHICYSRSPAELALYPDSYVVCENGVCQGVFPALPPRWQGIPCRDFGDRLIIPGLVDLHTHAAQYAYRGTGMDLELLDWLERYAFPEESKFADPDYARAAYTLFADDLRQSATTRAVVFATRHSEATLLLLELLEQSGVCAYVGKVSMDRNCPPPLCETGAADTAAWLETCAARGFAHIKPILTPRFVPSCSDGLLADLGALQKRYGVPVQSHLSENLDEVAWVRELCPGTAFYGEAYDRFGLFGGPDCPTVMAHCVYSTPAELALMKARGVFIAHCPQSNSDVASGIAPVRRYLEMGLPMGLGSDVAGGYTLSIFRTMVEAIQCSKLLWRLKEPELRPLSMPEAFYLATRGGGAFFGKVGAFEPGYAFDAVVLDDRSLPHPQPLPLADRLERLVYLSEGQRPAAKYVEGRQLF